MLGLGRNRWAALAGIIILIAAMTVAAAPQPASTVSSDAAFSITVWETDSGLPQNSIIALTQTRDGYLWMGTLGGLVRFDGLQFTVIDENSTPSLSSGRVTHLFEDNASRLWIGTEASGTYLLEDGRIEAPPELSLGGADRSLVSMCQDGEGAVWLSNANGDILRYHDEAFAPFILTPTEPGVRKLLVAEPSGQVWVGTTNRLCAVGQSVGVGALELPVAMEMTVTNLDFLAPGRHEGYWRLANGRIEKWLDDTLIRDLGPYPWNFSPVSAACEDREGNLVVGTRGAGLFWFDAEGRATSLSTNQGLSHNYVLSLLLDREGNLWVGTDGGGLNRVRKQVFTVLKEARGMVVQSVAQDAQGGLWIGAHQGGLSYWQDGTLHRLLANRIAAVFVDRDQRVWVGTRGAGLFQFLRDRFVKIDMPGLAQPVVQAFHQDPQGQIWMGTQNGLARWDNGEWTRYTTADGLSSDMVTALADGPEGGLWIGTERGGLNLYREERFTVFRKAEDGLPSDVIFSLLTDADGVLWVGTSSGLARYLGGKWSRFTTADGLVSNSIGYLLEDGVGDLWAGSPAGLMRVGKSALNALAEDRSTFVNVRAYGRADGLPSPECSIGAQPAAARGSGDILWFPTINGLAYLARHALRPNTNPPPVIIDAVLVDGRSWSGNPLRPVEGADVVLPPGKEQLEIRFSSLNLGVPERARLRYRLEGHETEWLDAGNSRVARYRKLPPGRYTFQVVGCNEDGVWNETGSTLGVIVQPPYWRTWWFLTMMTVSLVGMAVGVIHHFSTQKLQRQVAAFKQQEAIEKERARIARDIHDQLGASLTQVSLLGELVESDKDIPEEVEAHARQITQTARETTRTLDEIVWTVNPSHDTLDALVNYVCKYAQDYLAVAGVRYRLDVPSDLPETPLPPEVRHHVFLVAKEAVTNVVKHAKASSAWVRLQINPDSFSLQISDDGCGLAGMDPARAATRNGMRNMRTRMESVGGTFEMGPAPEGGLSIRLTVPIGTG